MNEFHDVSAARAAEMGFDVAAMTGEQAGSLFHVMSDERSDDTLFAQITNNAFVGRPDLATAGVRVWLMGNAMGVCMPRLDRAERAVMRKVGRIELGECRLLLGGVTCEQRLAVMELIAGDEKTLWRLGRRASLLAYALNRGVIIREALESFESIGHLWRLRADNKRSAVCEAMNQLRKELVHHGRLAPDFRFWFEKQAGARAVYAEVQKGNRNRAAHGMTNEEGRMTTAEECLGVPVREEWRALSAPERKRRLDLLWREHAWTLEEEEEEEEAEHAKA